MLSAQYLKYWIAFWFSLYLCNLNATHQTDSLVNILSSLPDGKQKLDVLDQLGNTMMLVDYDSTVYYANLAIPLAEKLNESKIHAKLLRRIGIYHLEKRELNEARKYGAEAANIIEQSGDGLEILDKQYIFLGRTFLFEEIPLYDSVLYYFKLAEESNIKNNFPPEYNWEVYNEYGKLYGELNQQNKADEYFQKAYDLSASQNNKYAFVAVRYSMMQYYFSSNQLEKYSKISEEYLQYQKQKTNNTIPDEGYHSEIFLFENLNEATKIERLENSIKFHKEFNNLGMLTETISLLASYYFSKNNCEKVLEVCQEGISEIAQSKEKIILREYYRKSYECSKQLNEVSNALNFYEKFVDISDSIIVEEISKNFSKLEIQYESQKKDLEIRETTFQRNMLLVASGLLALLAIAIFILLKNRLTTSKKLSNQSAELQEQKIKQLEQEKKILTYNAMIEGQESERKRIAKDLHDSIGGLLSTVKAHFTAINEDQEKEKDSELFQKTNWLIDEACDEVRRISQNMMPRALELSSLTHALEDISDHLNRRGIHCELEIIDLGNRISQSKKVMIYRILQELTTNILKHSGAKKVLIQLFYINNQINILVEDDGVGFDTNKAKTKKGLGMKSVFSRVQYLNGSIDLDSVIGEGTTVNISIPIE